MCLGTIITRWIKHSSPIFETQVKWVVLTVGSGVGFSAGVCGAAQRGGSGGVWAGARGSRLYCVYGVVLCGVAVNNVLVYVDQLTYKSAVRCGAVRCGAVWCGAVRCGAVR